MIEKQSKRKKIKLEASKETLQSLPKNAEELNQLSVSKRMKVAEDIGEIVGKTVNKAVQVANDFLKDYGYKVSVTLNFHEIEKDQQNQ